ncbi:MAG: type II secretion system protein GspL [Thermodesulfobacteriota bacterium]
MLALGVDATQEALTIALLETAGRTTRLVGTWREARGAARPLAEQLRALVERHVPSPPDAVASALPGSSVSHRVLHLPFADASRLAATVPFELESLVPFDVETGVIAFTVLEREADGAAVLAAIAQRADVERHLEEMRAAGLEPSLVDVATLALAGLVRPRSGDALVLDPRADGGVALFRAGRLTAFRVVDAPSPAERARELRWAALALLDGDGAPPVLVAAPADEAARSLGAGLAAEPLALATHLPGWAAGAPAADLRAVALAARAAGLSPLGLDFRTGELAYHAPSEEAWRQIRIAGWLAAAAVALGLVAFGAAVAERRAELASLRAEISRAVADVLPGAAPGTERTRLEGAIETLEKRRAALGGAAAGRPPTLELLHGIDEAVPDQVPVTIEDVAIDDDGVRLHARTDSYESVDVVKRALQGVPGLFDPEVKDVKTGVDGRIEFRVALRFTAEPT